MGLTHGTEGTVGTEERVDAGRVVDVVAGEGADCSGIRDKVFKADGTGRLRPLGVVC